MDDYKHIQEMLYGPPGMKEPASCTWSEDDDGNWSTSCDLEWCSPEYGTFKENGYVYCPGCGKPIEYHEHKENKDE